jgi:hypothetical protein
MGETRGRFYREITYRPGTHLGIYHSQHTPDAARLRSRGSAGLSFGMRPTSISPESFVVLFLGLGGWAAEGAAMPRIKIPGAPLRNRIRRVETRVARMLAPAYAAIIRSMRVLHYRRRTPNAFRAETYPAPTPVPNDVGRSQPKLLRDRAEECRALAQIVTDQHERDGYLKMAQMYEELAAQEEAQTRSNSSPSST